MAQRQLTSPQQTSFLEMLLRADESAPASAAFEETIASTPNENFTLPNLSPTTDEMADLFGLISEVKQLEANKAQTDATQRDQDFTIITVAPEQSPLAPEWILKNCHEHVVQIAAVLNSMCESESLPPLEQVENVLASQLENGLGGVFADNQIKQTLQEYAHNLEKFAHSLYGDGTAKCEEISRSVDALLERMPHQPYEGESIWIRRAMQVAVRKTLAEKSQNIYTALGAATTQRPVREVVRDLLEANQIPFPARVLAQARERDYAKTIRESLQTLARLGFTAQTMTHAWQAVRQGQNDLPSPWIARRADGCVAVILNGQAILESRVVRSSKHAIVAMFDASKRITRQMTIETSSMEQAKKTLGAQGYRNGEDGLALAERVVKLWSEFCRARDNGWWFGDEQGRVMVVIPYALKRRLGYHKPLCRAVAQMQAWGYRFRYDEHTLYFMPKGVELPAFATSGCHVEE